MRAILSYVKKYKLLLISVVNFFINGYVIFIARLYVNSSVWPVPRQKVKRLVMLRKDPRNSSLLLLISR